MGSRAVGSIHSSSRHSLKAQFYSWDTMTLCVRCGNFASQKTGPILLEVSRKPELKTYLFVMICNSRLANPLLSSNFFGHLITE